MKNGSRTGLFLCQCGNAISDRVDLPALEERMKGEEGVVSVQCRSHYCTSPGLKELARAVEAHGLDRVLLGACSDRVMKPKIAEALNGTGLLGSQIEMVNLKDHVALVHEEPVAELTRKAGALLSGALASLRHLEPLAQVQAEFSGKALILGGGISGFQAARELARNSVESVLFSDFDSPEEVLADLPGKYPGSRLYFEELETLLKEVFANPFVDIVSKRPIEYLDGHVGDYRIGMIQPNGNVREITGAAVILALDREYLPDTDTPADALQSVMGQVELEDRLARDEITSGRMVFLVNGRTSTQKGHELSAISAWQNSLFLAQKYPDVTATVLCPSDTRLSLTGADMVAARNLGVELMSYNPDVHPMVHADHLTYVSPQDQKTHKMTWDNLVVSAVTGPPVDKSLDVMRYLPVFADEEGLKKLSMRVKTGQEPVEWAILAGSAQQPCSLNEALYQGKRAARKVLDLRKKAQKEELIGPLSVATVDADVCVGCGLCNEICPTGAMENVKPGKVAVPRKSDPLACVGCGSCAAACPHGAITLQNNSTQQLHERVKAVLSQMRENDVLGFACSWGGQGAAELAAAQKLTYPSRLFIIPVQCLGSIDPSILSMAFLHGANSIMLTGCTPSPTSSCHYGHGVDHTWFRVNVVKKLLSMSGLEPERISLGYVDVNEPGAFVAMAKTAMADAERLGPIARSEDRQKRLLAAHATLHYPRLRWVLGTCLRRPSEIDAPDDQRNTVSFDQLVQDVMEQEYLAARIVGVLKEVPGNPPTIAEALGEPTPDISKALVGMVKDSRVVRSWEHPYTVYAIAQPK